MTFCVVHNDKTNQIQKVPNIALSVSTGVPHVPGQRGKAKRIRRTTARVGRTKIPVSAATAATSTTAADDPRATSLRTAKTTKQPTHQLTNRPLPKPNRAEPINRHRLDHLHHPAGSVLVRFLYIVVIVQSGKIEMNCLFLCHTGLMMVAEMKWTFCKLLTFVFVLLLQYCQEETSQDLSNKKRI